MLSDIQGHQAPTTPCRGCNRPVVWLAMPDGKRIPVDATAACYEIKVVDRGTGQATGDRTTSVGVNHFALCTQRDRAVGAGANRRLVMRRR